MPLYTITQAGRFNQFGQPLLVSVTYDLSTEFGNALVSSGFAMSADLSVPDVPSSALGIGQNILGGLHGPLGVFSGSGIPDGTFSNQTIQNQQPAFGPFAGVRLIYTNQHASLVTVTTAKVASPTVSASNGAGLGWLSATVAGAASFNLPGSVGAAPDEVVTPVATDFLALQNANSLNLSMTRTYFAANVGGTSAASLPAGDSPVNITNWRAVSGMEYYSARATGVIADGAGITMGGGSLSAMVVPDAVLFYYTVPTIYVAYVGGSHLRGNGTTGEAFGFIYRACRQLTTPDLIYAPWNSARGGSSSAAAVQNLTNILAIQKPDVVVVLGYSGNDSVSPTASTFANARANLGRQLELCRRNNVLPIICTAPPIVTYDNTQRILLQNHNNWLRSLRTYGFIVFDLNMIYRDPANINQLLPLYNSGDNIHTNDIAQGVAAGLFAQLMTRLRLRATVPATGVSFA